MDASVVLISNRGMYAALIFRALSVDMSRSCEGRADSGMRLHFEQCVLDTECRELRRGSTAVAVQPQVFDLLVYLIENRDRVVSKDDLLTAVWNGRIVSESTLISRINAARRAIGDDGDQQRLIRTVLRKGVRFVADVEVDKRTAPPIPPVSRYDPVTDASLNQQVRCCRTRDGVRLAYAAVGSGPPILQSAHWLSHLEYDWELPIARYRLLDLAKAHSLVRYDARGNGLSAWDVSDMSFDAWVSDMETVVDAAGLDRFPVLAISQSVPVSIAYAARHPDRVSCLILYGGFAAGRNRRSDIPAADRERVAAMRTLIKLGWGSDDPTFRQIFASQMMPTATREQADAFNELQRFSASPDCAVRYFDSIGEFDVRHLLPLIKAPTLVMHVRDDASVPIALGREIAAGIPNARFVALPGRNHILLEQDPATSRFSSELRSFVKQHS